MLSVFRKLAGTWVARIFFGALALAFVGWGVANRGTLSSVGLGSNDVVTVDGHGISPQIYSVAFKAELENVAKKYGDAGSLPPELKRRVAQEVLQRLVAQQAMSNHAEALGITTPDSQVASAISAMPAFQGITGKFDRGAYLQTLSQSNLAPTVFQEEVRTEATRNQILDTLTAASIPSDQLATLVYNYAAEARRADVVSLPISGRAAPAAPPERTLQRYYDNNITRYTAPEYRHVKLVVLSPATIGRGLPLTDADMHAWLTAHKSEFEFPETRDLQVIATSTQAEADALAAQWRGGADWTAMQAAAKARKATAVSLDKTDKAGVPTPELADAAFGAMPGVVVGPIKEPLGFQLVRVSNIVPAKHGDFTALHDTIRARLGEEKAAELIDARAQKLQDLFAGGSRIDEIPADIGASGDEGTMDATGNTLEGVPAPIPVTDKVRTLIVADVFKATKNDAPQLIEGPDHVWYALALQDIIKPTAKPFDKVRAQVLADWQYDQIRHTQEAAAAKILSLVNGGQTLTNAAWGTGLTVSRTPPLQRRGSPPAGLTPAMVQTLFTLKQGQATMAENSDGFVVASVAEIGVPAVSGHQAEYKELKTGLGKSLADDLITAYALGVQATQKVSVNGKLMEQFTQAPTE